jgi:hypothetical protein
MKTLTKQQAIDLYNSEVWKDWTDEKIVRVQLFQERLCVDFRKFHEALENVLGRGVFTHELSSSNIENIYKEYLGVGSQPTLDEIINLIPKNKRIIL